MDEGGVEYNARPKRCRRCESIEVSARAFAGIEETDPMAGIKWHVTKAED